jgi:hypothetical protein
MKVILLIVLEVRISKLTCKIFIFQGLLVSTDSTKWDHPLQIFSDCLFNTNLLPPAIEGCFINTQRCRSTCGFKTGVFCNI